MFIASRFSRERVVHKELGPPPGFSTQYHDVTEEKFKREQLRRDLY